MAKKPITKKPVAKKPVAKNPAGGHMHDMGNGMMMRDEDMKNMMAKKKMPPKGMMR